ncbi:MAG: class III extradiol ring-cleavage dioxygenase [Myxococcota bacterium]
MSSRMPTAFLPHGGGPYSYVDFGAPQDEVEDLAQYWRRFSETLPSTPPALLVVSAHWEEARPTVMTSPSPPMLFDYYNFPPAAYELSWPAPGAPHLAERVRTQLGEAGIDTADDGARGFDHGTFVPLGRIFPASNVPTLQLSLKAGLDPEEHLAIGRAIAPLRDEGVLILGSGMSYHNMQGFRRPDADDDARAFDDWLAEVSQDEHARRDEALLQWERAPRARACHPREEHLLPLMVVAGAASSDTGTIGWRGNVFGKTVSAVHFG